MKKQWDCVLQNLGEWEGSFTHLSPQGEAVTLDRDGRSSVTDKTSLKCDRQNENQLVLSSGNETDCPIKIAENSNQSCLNFEQNSQQYQIVLLPDGAASTCPAKITPGNPFFMEVSWLIQPRLRQRMIRSYDDKGKWDSLTLVTESRINGY